jgi:hypothetical protein
MQQNNAREIVQHLAADPHYFGAVCAALRAAPASAADGASPPAAGRLDERWAGCGEPRAPASENRALQLWGLLVELCTMAAPLHVIQRALLTPNPSPKPEPQSRAPNPSPKPNPTPKPATLPR